MPILTFSFSPSESSNDHQARVIMDGVDVVESIDHEALGIDPPEFFRQDALRSSGALLIGRCSCGCVGCCDIRVEVLRTGTQVIWRSEYPSMKEISFEQISFDEAIKTASQDTSWETIERKIERQIGLLDFRTFEDRGLIFDWASARFDKETIRLSFHIGSRQEMYSIRWDHVNEADALHAAKEFIERHA